MRAIGLIAIAAVALAIVLSGCSKPENTKVQNVPPSLADKEVTEKNLGVPVYPGAKLNLDLPRPMGMPESVQRTVISTPDSLEKVYNFYKDNLKDVEDPMLHEMDGAMMGMMSGKANDGGKINVHITTDKVKKLTNIQVFKQPAQ